MKNTLRKTLRKDDVSIDAAVKAVSTTATGTKRPTRQEAEDAVRTLLAWTGDDPTREGLLDTPKRVVNAYREFFSGYEQDADAALSRTFRDVGGYDDIVLLSNIDMNSHCEHHIIPFVGKAHIAYLPNEKVVGLSKLARVVEIYSRRLQTQETMTAQIAGSIERALEPQGVAVMIDAEHQCMSMRGVQKPGVSTITTQFIGVFKTDMALQARFIRLVRDTN